MPLFLQKIYPQNLACFVWKVSEELGFFVDALLEEERQELSQIVQPTKQIEFTAVRYLARIVCDKVLCLPYRGIGKDANGKPFFKEITYEISISHCLPYVGIALHPSQSVGIDIEQEQNKLLKIAPRVLSAQEMHFCQNNLQKHCIVWCCKEALYKIYAKKGLTFRTDLLVTDFEGSAEVIKAQIKTNTYHQNCLLYHSELEKGVHLCCGM